MNRQTIENEARSMSVFCRAHPLEALRPRLAAEGIVTAKELRRLPSGKRVRITGVLVIVHMPPTKSGKRVIFITLEDETGLIDLVVFPRAQVKYAKALLTSEVQTVEGKLHRAGKDGRAISIVVESVIPHLTGSLEKVLQLGNSGDIAPSSGAEAQRSHHQ
ncbi:MAG: OB-fold nucleic acid binding domain-containing protein [Thermodesulfobacteriota bacterium]